MKFSPALPALAGLLVLALRAGAAPVSSTLTAVTVYTDRAVVTRTAAVDLTPGTSELVFANLPETLDDRSLQVAGRGTAGATILDVSARRTFVDFTPNARVQELADQLKGLQQQLRGLDDRGTILKTQEAMLDRMETALFAPPTKDVPRPDLGQLTTALTFLTEQNTKNVTDRATLDQQREELQGRINTVQNQLNELRGGGGKAYQSVTVRVSAAQAGALDLSLSYTVPGASWVPNYDARALGGEHAVALGYFGIVRQNTGEDWKDVALTLSTARPGLGGAAPVLPAWNLDLFNPIALREEARRDRIYAAKALNAPAAAPAVGSLGLMQNAEAAPAEVAAATLEAGATSAVFRVALPSSIASDNSPQKVPITSVRLATDPAYATTPKRLAAAFLTARVTNTTDFPLLAGAMNVFLDGTFVATSRLATIMPGEKFDLALGADEGIAVRHRRVQKFTEDTGLTNSGKRITYEYLLTIQNNKKTAERVVVTDQVPVSRHEKIVVKVLAPDPKDVKPTDEGLLQWTLDLKPGEKRELTVKFAVEFANDVNITGLE